MSAAPLYSTQHDALVDPPALALLIALVNDALRSSQSLLALSRSPLANSPLVTPALVKDEVAPTAEERGAALRLALRWAVTRLAPAQPAYPFGDFRPFDDPTWRDPRWWRYTILRHRYLEPLHPDDFTGGGRFTETLLALTGIRSADALYDERNRAINEAAEWLRRQWLENAYHGELQQMAVAETLAPLERQPQAQRLLAIAAAFDEVFPREQLLDLARREALDRAEAGLEAVIAQRFLLTGDEGANLWLAPPLRAHLYARQPASVMQHRHRLIAAHAAAQGRLLAAVRHYQRGGQESQAARLLLPAVAALQQEIEPAALIELLQAFNVRRLDADARCTLHLTLSDLLYRTGQPEAALAAGRQALQAAPTIAEQARAYRRIGKLYESRNPQHALRYYQQAIERFPTHAPELAEALKDRGWLYFLRQEWEKAEADLLCALEVVHDDARSLQGAIYDAMANLYRKTGAHDRAVSYAELALALREEDGDLLGVAKSHGNLGLLYRSHGEYAHAIAAYTEAMATYARIGNQELVAVALLNIGAASFLDGKIAAAIGHYQKSLAISQTLDLALLAIKAHYNLAEASAAQDQPATAREHWQIGLHLCRQHAFDDQEQDFAELGATLGLALHAASTAEAGAASPAAPLVALDREEAAVLALAQREGQVTAQRLIESLHVSRATATRRLAALVEKGLLQMAGKGRGVHYRPASAQPGVAAEAAVLSDAAPTAAALPVTALSVTALSVTALSVEMERELQELLPGLRVSFGVAGLSVAPPPAPGVVRLAVRFVTAPDLAGFFALERHLCDALRRAVDLVPEA